MDRPATRNETAKIRSTSLIVLLLAAAFFCPSFAQAQRRQNAINFVGDYKKAQDQRQDADKKLIDKMEDVAEWLIQFRLRYGHFPESGTEEDNATAFLQRKKIKPNPFTMTGVASEEEKVAACPLRFVHEVGLVDSWRQEWEKKPPQNWKAEPGTITIVENEYDYIVIWGAGADPMPIYDGKNNKCWLVWRNLL